MRVGEIETYAVDYSTVKTLAPDEIIIDAVWTLPAGLAKVGLRSIVGLRVSQQISAVLAGRYRPICTGTTNLGNVIILPDPGKGLLLVV